MNDAFMRTTAVRTCADFRAIQHGADRADPGWIDPLLVFSTLGSCKRKFERWFNPGSTFNRAMSTYYTNHLTDLAERR